MLFTSELKVIEAELQAYSERLERKKILITGGTGYLGKNILMFLQHLQKKISFEVYVVSRDPQKFISQYPELNSFYFIKAKLSSLKDLPTDFDYILHLAADYNNPIDINNEKAFIHFLDRNSRLKKIFFASSGAVYGDSKNAPFSEDTPPGDCNEYGKSKLRMEKLLLEIDAPIVIGRIFSIIGPYFDFSSHFAFVQFLQQALQEKIIKIHSDGKAQRSFLNSFDFCSWMAMLLLSDLQGIYNLGSQRYCSIIELAETIASQIEGSQIHILGSSITSKSLAQNFYYPSIEKIKSDLKVNEKFNLKQSIEQSIRYLSHTNLVI